MAARATHPDAAFSLALAVVDSSTAPLVLLDGELKVVAISASFCQAFHLDPAAAVGDDFFLLGKGEWDVSQLRGLLRGAILRDVAVNAHEFDLVRPGRETRRLILDAHRLAYGDDEHPRLILSVADVTEARLAARLKDDLLREKGVLVQEVQHRVANSLQIIASVLLQSARRLDPGETRNHLHDAHQRVMSVAHLQRQLAASTLGQVEMRTYLTNLCQDIDASMIRDRTLRSLTVKSDEHTISAEIAVSLGLMVTELVINAIKHAFPDNRGGAIVVEYRSRGQYWSLSVADDGQGILTGSQPAKGGLGTSIIEALAKRLNAHIDVSDTKPGTSVVIRHAQADVEHPRAARTAI